MKTKQMVVTGLVASARELRSQLDNMLEVTKGNYTEEVHEIAVKLDNCERLIKEQYTAAVHKVEIGNINSLMTLEKLKKEVLSYFEDAGFVRKEEADPIQEMMNSILGGGGSGSGVEELLGAILGRKSRREEGCGRHR